MNWLAIRRWFEPPVFAEAEKSRRAALLNTVAWWLIVALGIGAFILTMSGPLDAATAVILGGGATLSVALLALNRAGFTTGGSWLLILVLLLLVSTDSYYFNGLRNPDVMAYALIILLAGLLLGPGPAMGLTLASLTALAGLFAAEEQGWLPAPQTITAQQILFLYGLNFAMLGGVVVLAAQSYQRALAAARQTEEALNANNQQLNQIRLQLEAEAATRHRDIEAVFDLSRLLAQAYLPEQLLLHATQLFCDSFAMHHVSLFLHDPARRVLRSRITVQRSEAASRSEIIAPLEVNAQAVAAAAQMQEIVLLGNALADSLINRPHWQVCLPMQLGGQPLGVLDLHSDHDNLSPNELPILAALLTQIAVAYENGALLQLADQARRDVEVQARRLSRQGWDDYLNAIERGETVGFAFDGAQIKPFARATPPINTRVTATPIAITEAHIGVVELHAEVTRTWAPDEAEFVRAVAQQVAQRVENLRLLAQAEAARAEAEAATQRLTAEGWADYLQTTAANDQAFMYTAGHVRPLGNLQAASEAPAQTVQVRGWPVGELGFLKAPEGVTGSDIPPTQWLAIVAQSLGAHIDNLRLTAQAQRAQAEAERQSRTLQAILDHLPIGVLVIDPTGHPQILNPIGRHILGETFSVELSAFDYATALELYRPGTMARAVAGDLPIVRALQTQMLQHGELDFHRAEGPRLTIDTTAAPILNANGQLTAVVALFQDVTERKLNEALLAKRAAEIEDSNRFLDLVIDNLPVMLFVKDADELRFLRWNRAGEEIVGFSRDNMLGKNDYDFFPAAQADFFTRNDRAALEGKMLVDIPEEPIDTQHKGQRWLHTRKIPILDAHGDAHYLLGISEDITEQKRIQQHNALLNDLARRLNTVTGAEEAARIVLDVAEQLVGWDAAWLGLCANDPTRLQYVLLLDTVDGEVRDFTGAERAVVTPSEDAHKAMTDGPHLILRDRPPDAPLARSFGNNRPSASLMFVPIFYGSYLLGAMSIQSYTYFVYNHDSLHLLQTLADYVAGAFSRLQAEADLRVRNRALEATTQPVLIADALRADIPIIYVNPAFEQVTGYTAAEVLGRNGRFLHGVDRDQPGLQELRRALREMRPCTVEVRNYRKDGALFWNELTVSPVPDVAGRVTHYVGFENDITARKQAEADLRHQKELFENLVAVARATITNPTLEATLQNALDVAVTITTAERGSLFLVGPDGEVTHGILARGEMLRPVRRALAYEVMERGLAGWVYRSRIPALIEDTLTDPRWLRLPNEPYIIRSAIAAPILLGEAVLGLLTLFHAQPRHFTTEHEELLKAAADQMALSLRNAQFYEEQQRLAEELRQAKDAAEDASRAKTLFLAKMSHELRTPLTVILGYNELLLEDANDHGYTELLSGLQKVDSSARHLLTLINEVLDYSKIEAGKLELRPETFALNEWLPDIASTAQALAERNTNQFEMIVPPKSLGLMEVDPTRLRQILLNLLSNAHKFTHAGQVKLTVSSAPTEHGDLIQFVVQDTGIGMTPAQMQKIFQPFTQADSSTTRKYGGTGLGLVITRQLCQLMGGDITMQSEVDKGTTMTVTLPRRMEPRPVN